MISKVYDVIGNRPSALSRMSSPVRWATPNPKRRIITMGNGRKIMPNRGAVVLRGSRG